MVISLTKMIVEIGVLETAVKKPAMPTTTKAPGSVTTVGMMPWNIFPTAPPMAPPMTTEGPKTPPLPPDPMEKEVVSTFPSARETKKGTVSSLLIAIWAKP